MTTTRTLWLPWLAVALLGATVLGLSVAAVRYDYVPGDVLVAQSVQRLQSPAVSAVLLGVSVLGGSAPTALVMAAMAAILAMGRRLWEAAVAAALLAAMPLPEAVKPVVGRPRPTDALVEVSWVSDDPSFPSGHVYAATLFTVVVLVVAARCVSAPVPRRLLQAAAIVWVVLMAVSRVYLGAHWPSDTLGGVAWGALVGAVLLATLAMAFPPAPRPGERPGADRRAPAAARRSDGDAS